MHAGPSLSAVAEDASLLSSGEGEAQFLFFFPSPTAMFCVKQLSSTHFPGSHRKGSQNRPAAHTSKPDPQRQQPVSHEQPFQLHDVSETGVQHHRRVVGSVGPLRATGLHQVREEEDRERVRLDGGRLAPSRGGRGRGRGRDRAGGFLRKRERIAR